MTVQKQQDRTRRTQASSLYSPRAPVSVFLGLNPGKSQMARGLRCKSQDQALGALREAGELGGSTFSQRGLRARECCKRHRQTPLNRRSPLHLLINMWQLCSKTKALWGGNLWLITHCRLKSKCPEPEVWATATSLTCFSHWLPRVHTYRTQNEDSQRVGHV